MHAAAGMHARCWLGQRERRSRRAARAPEPAPEPALPAPRLAADMRTFYCWDRDMVHAIGGVTTCANEDKAGGVCTGGYAYQNASTQLGNPTWAGKPNTCGGWVCTCSAWSAPTDRDVGGTAPSTSTRRGGGPGRGASTALPSGRPQSRGARCPSAAPPNSCCSSRPSVVAGMWHGSDDMMTVGLPCNASGTWSLLYQAT